MDRTLGNESLTKEKQGINMGHLSMEKTGKKEKQQGAPASICVFVPRHISLGFALVFYPNDRRFRRLTGLAEGKSFSFSSLGCYVHFVRCCPSVCLRVAGLIR